MLARNLSPADVGPDTWEVTATQDGYTATGHLDVEIIPIPIAVMFTPGSADLPDNAPAGAYIATVTVTMSDGSPLCRGPSRCAANDCRDGWRRSGDLPPADICRCRTAAIQRNDCTLMAIAFGNATDLGNNGLSFIAADPPIIGAARHTTAPHTLGTGSNALFVAVEAPFRQLMTLPASPMADRWLKSPNMCRVSKIINDASTFTD